MLDLFDANCALGMVSVPGPAGAFLTAAELVEHQAQYAITRALPYHALAREQHAALGNPALTQAIEGFPNLLPSWVVLPHHTGEFPAPAQLLDEARSAGVRAFRIFPDEHRIPMDDWMVGDLLTAIEGQVPLFWHIDQLLTDTARDLYRVGKRYPRLQIVVTDVDKMINRVITPLLRALPNLWLETSGYRIHRGHEYIAGAVGDERMLFGTNLPWQSSGGPHAEFLYADLSAEARARIGGLNLESLLATAAW
ncbi:MAG: amidohydrolase family protein [Actinobacteria bacterium]|nr:amidohydrolase family protein [Actinomycetota bacterium]